MLITDILLHHNLSLDRWNGLDLIQKQVLAQEAGEPFHLITIEECAEYAPKQATKEKLWHHLNQHYYGAERIPLNVQCTKEHQAAASRAVRGYTFRVKLVYSQHGELVHKEFSDKGVTP